MFTFSLPLMIVIAGFVLILTKLIVGIQMGDGATKYVIPTSSDLVNVLNLDGSGIVPLRKKTV